MSDLCFFVSDLHGNKTRYEKLFSQVEKKKPQAVFLGGDLLPASVLHQSDNPGKDPGFLRDFLLQAFRTMKKNLGSDYPEVFLILGNDDPRSAEPFFLTHAEEGLWRYMHEALFDMDGTTIYGYSHVPPTPFLLKDWERYDVSRYVDPGCIHPTEGFRTVPAGVDLEFETIKKDLEKMTAGKDLSKSVFLFHSPPYKTMLDRAGLDGVMIDHVPADVHVGSIAIREFIDGRQPMLTLHGHIHESSRITGAWKQRIEKTWSLSAAHDGTGLALVMFRLACPGSAERLIV
jgi:uncharacterized protein